MSDMYIGSGKSLCYLVPALVTKQISIVISPLISLMMDQCRAINNICDENVACFLGSAQYDRSVRTDALAGLYSIVYTTPETLLTIL